MICTGPDRAELIPLLGVAVDEGESLGAVHKRCDLNCCRLKCASHPHCNSISHRHDRSLCYLKDACLTDLTPVKSASRYVSHFRPCGEDASGSSSGDQKQTRTTYNTLGVDNGSSNSTAEHLPEGAAILNTIEATLDDPALIAGPIKWKTHSAVHQVTADAASQTCSIPRCGSGSSQLGTWVHPQVFQPFGCWRPQYETTDAAQCLQNKRVALVGDSLSRFMYWCMAYYVTGAEEYETMCRNYHKSQQDMGPIVLKTGQDSTITLDFRWVPSISGADYKGLPMTKATFMQQKLEDIVTSGEYDVVVLNMGLWDMLHLDISRIRTEMGLQQMMNKLDQLALRDDSKVPELIWMNVQSVVEEKTNPRRSNDDIIAWNTMVKEVLSRPGTRSQRQFFQFLDAFEMTITADPARTLRDDGRHYFSNIVLQIVNAALNLVCDVPSIPYAQTVCTKRLLPEIHGNRLTRGVITDYLSSEWILLQDTRSQEEINKQLYPPGNYEAVQPRFARNGVPIIIKGGPDILDLSHLSEPQRLDYFKTHGARQTVGVRGYPKNESHVRLAHYIDNIMFSAPTTTMSFSGNVGNSKISPRSFESLKLSRPRWFASDEYERPEQSSEASLWMSHAGGTTPLHRDHIHSGNIAQLILGGKKWWILPPWVAPWACIVHNDQNKVGFSKARHPNARHHWEKVCPTLEAVIDQLIVIDRIDPPDGLFIPGGSYLLCVAMRATFYPYFCRYFCRLVSCRRSFGAVNHG